MALLKRLHSFLTPAAVALPLAFLVAVPAFIRAEDPAPAKEDAADKDPGDQAAPKIEKVEKKAEVTPDAQAVLDRVRDSYKALNTLSMQGKVSADVEIDGQKNNESSSFTASFEAPNKFRHELEKDILLGSTGEKMFAFKPDRNTYIIDDAPKEKTTARELPATIAKILDQQNPAMLLALAPDAGAQMVDGIAKAEKGEDTKIGDTSYTVLKLTGSNNADVKMFIDPTSNLLRRVSIDMKRAVASGGQDVVKALFTIDYSEVTANPKFANDSFAWAPPEGSKEFAAAHDEGEATVLEGKMAADISIAGLDGKEVRLKDLRGQVVVLDFWATWCAPCRIGLPLLDKMYQAMKEKKVKIFALNMGEDKPDIDEFVKTTKLTVPILVDAENKAAGAFKADTIPETVVVGKDGKIIKVFLGIPDAKMYEELQRIVEEAMK